MDSPAHTGHIQLGTTGLQIALLGTGTWAWGARLWGYGRGGYTDADLRAAFQTALAAGVNFFDTAEEYGHGRSESLLGQFIREARRPVVVTTKFMPYPWRWRRKSLLRALRGSLERLGLDQVDLYLIHWPLPPVSIETWADALADAVEAGLARAVGVSNFDVSEMRRAHEVLSRRGVSLAANQVQYSLLRRDPERNGLLETCRHLGVTLIAYSPLAMGILTGKYTPDNPPPGYRGRRFGPEKLAQTRALLELLREIGQAHEGKTPAQVALNWVICKGAVPIPGAKNADHAAQSAGALGWRLTVDELAALDRTSENSPSFPAL